MNWKIVSIFIISLFGIIIPVASAQETNEIEKINNKSIEVKISENGNIQVTHIVDSSDSPKQVKLIDGTIQNLTVTNEEGKQAFDRIDTNNSLVIFPSKIDTIIEYNLEDVLLQKNNLWKLDFLYLEKTTFIIPEELDLVFVNNRPVYLDEKKGFTCHGCQMILEYSFEEPKYLEKIKWKENEFAVEISTFSDFNNFKFDQTTKSINLDFYGENEFFTTIIPVELLGGPYTVFHDEKKISFHEYINNGTHVWLNMRPETSGEISIIGTTVIPEFSVIAPLAIGFLMIIILPFVKKLVATRSTRTKTIFINSNITN